MEKLVEDNPDQREVIKNQLIPMVSRNLIRLKDFKTGFEKEGQGFVDERIREGSGKRISDSISGLLNQISMGEKSCLKDREAEMKQLMDFSYYTRVFSSFFIMAVIGLALVILRRRDYSIDRLLHRLENQNEILLQNARNLEEKSAALEEANRMLEDTNSQLKKLNADKNRFLSMAAHDLNNPMIAITSLA